MTTEYVSDLCDVVIETVPTMIAAALLFLLVACATPGPETAITREVMDNGGGNPAVVSDFAMGEWFRRHPKFAYRISEQCRALTDKPLGWSDTTEGRVCTYAAVAAWSAPGGEVGRDHAAF
jgi:hypothetical protein